MVHDPRCAACYPPPGTNPATGRRECKECVRYATGRKGRPLFPVYKDARGRCRAVSQLRRGAGRAGGTLMTSSSASRCLFSCLPHTAEPAACTLAQPLQCTGCPYAAGWARCDQNGACKDCRFEDGWRLEGGRCTTKWATVDACLSELHAFGEFSWASTAPECLLQLPPPPLLSLLPPPAPLPLHRAAASPRPPPDLQALPPLRPVLAGALPAPRLRVRSG